MSLAIAIQMDPVETLHIAGDTTFALGLEAQKRGHSLWYYTADRLSLNAGRITARGQEVTFYDQAGAHFKTGKLETRSLQEFDVILMRQDPPFDMAYITATHLLEMLGPQTMVVNNPAEVRNAPEKLLVTLYPDLMPATLISRDPETIMAFRQKHKDIIIKPLFGNGGAGVFRLQPNDQNLSSLLEMFFGASREPVMVQAYLPSVRDGDKRVILVDDSIVRGTTSIKIVNMMRQAGASEVHMRIASPPTTHPCFYGVDTPDRDKLIAASMDTDAIAEHIGVDSLAFISIDGLYRALNETSRNANAPQYCDACFTGEYPIAPGRSDGHSTKGIISK